MPTPISDTYCIDFKNRTYQLGQPYSLKLFASPKNINHHIYVKKDTRISNYKDKGINGWVKKIITIVN